MSTIQARIRNDARVREISDERGLDSGIWVYLKGHCNELDNPHECSSESCVHSVHEDTWTACLKVLRYVKSCTCAECLAEKAPNGARIIKGRDIDG